MQRVTEVVFAATPHTGSQQGSLLDRLRFLAWPSTIASVLVANDPTLRSINVAYRGLAQSRKDVLHHRIFYETQDTNAGRIVDEASADPGLPGDPPVPIDADHISIVKPRDRSALLYVRTKDFIARNPTLAETPGALEILPLPPVPSEQSRNLVPKLVRIAAIGLVGFTFVKGLQWWIAPPPDVAQIQKPLVEQLATKDAQIAALTQALLEKNPGAAAGPGAQQAVGGALQSIAQGAAEGDQRLQQAFDLLKRDKVAEATQLLNAVAEDRSAQAERAVAQAQKDREIAATAFRNLGAIAGLRDPKKALEAYTKAAELDPNDIESAFWVGWIQISHGDLKEAQRQLQRTLVRARRDNNDYYETWSLIGLGDVQVAQGDLKAALQSYSDSRAIVERLAKSDPGNAGWQHDLSVSYEQDRRRAGCAGRSQSGAADPIPTAAPSDERLAKSDPGNAGWQRDLSVSYNKIGDVQVAQGDLKAALQSYSDSRAIFERLAKSDPGNAGWQYDLGISNERIGNVQFAQGDHAGALRSYRARQEIISRLAASDPGNAGWQRDLSVSYNKIGNVQVAQGDLKAALKSLSDSLAIRVRLAEAGLPPEKFSNRGRQALISRFAHSRRVQSSLRGRPLGSPHVGVGWWIGRSDPRSDHHRDDDDRHFRGRPDPRHASRRGRAVGAKSALHGFNHAAFALQRNAVFVFHMA